MPYCVGWPRYVAERALVNDPWLTGERKRAWLAHMNVLRRVTYQLNGAVAGRSG
jgi:hypothetical protein